MSSKLTIREIAQQANVSHTTVSRVLNDNPNVRPETRDRVLAVVRAHDFVPNPRARAFSSNKSRIIGLLINDISNPFFAELARGMEDKAYEHKYYVIICSTDEKLKNRQDYLQFLMRAGVDGLAYASVRENDKKIEKLKAGTLPVMMVNQVVQGEHFSHVVCDNRKGIRMLIDHLVGLGYSKIGIVCGPDDIYTGRERMAGYFDALKAHDLTVDDRFIFQAEFSIETGYQGAKKILALEAERPEAIVAGNDSIVRGVLDAIRDESLHVPRDIAVVGFDNSKFAAHSRILLTTIDQKKYQMGSITADLLINMIENGNSDYTHRVIVEPNLVVRESCGIKARAN